MSKQKRRRRITTRAKNPHDRAIRRWRTTLSRLRIQTILFLKSKTHKWQLDRPNHHRQQGTTNYFMRHLQRSRIFRKQLALKRCSNQFQVFKSLRSENKSLLRHPNRWIQLSSFLRGITFTLSAQTSKFRTAWRNFIRFGSISWYFQRPVSLCTVATEMKWRLLPSLPQWVQCFPKYRATSGTLTSTQAKTQTKCIRSLLQTFILLSCVKEV